MTYTPSNILQYNACLPESERRQEYYAHGLSSEGSWTRSGSDNNHLYNAGSELNSTTEWYETFYRGYDPTLGRFLQVDPLADQFGSHTPYNYAFNDPIFYNDPNGDQPVTGVREGDWWNYMRAGQRVYVDGSGGGGGRGGPVYGGMFDDFNTRADAYFGQENAERYASEYLYRLTGQRQEISAGSFYFMDDVPVTTYFNSGGEETKTHTGIWMRGERRQGGVSYAEFADGANYNFTSYSSLYGLQSFLTDNDSFWRGKNGQFYSKNSLYKNYWGTGGKYAKGVSAYRASAKAAGVLAQSLDKAGKLFGGLGVVATVGIGFSDGVFSTGDTAKTIIGVLTVVTPYGWVYGIADITLQVTTGTSITDHVGNFVDKHW